MWSFIWENEKYFFLKSHLSYLQKKKIKSAKYTSKERKKTFFWKYKVF